MFSTYAICDVFKDCEILCAIPDNQHRVYKGISILPVESEYMSVDLLYTCTLREALGRSIARPDCHYVCTCDLSPDDAAELTSRCSNIFCLLDQHDVSWIFFQLQNRFLYLQDWIVRMDNALHAGCDFQDLVDISEDVLKNPIFVQDPAFRLLATSKNYEGSSEIQRAYQKNKYHTPEFIEELERKGRFKMYKHTEGLFISRDHAIEPFDVITKIKRKGAIVTLTAGVSCSVTPYSPYYCELIEKFSDYIFLCDDMMSARNPESANPATSLIKDIISGEISGETRIADCARSMWFSFVGPYYLYQIDLSRNDLVSPPHLERELRLALGLQNIFYFANEVLILADCQSLVDDILLSEVSATISRIAQAHNCKCAVSEPFKNLAGLKKAYEQTTYTLSFIRKYASAAQSSLYAPNSQKTFLSRCLYAYREVFIRSIFDHYSENGPCAIDNVLFVTALQRLVDFDKEHGKDLVKTLYYYICNERNASKTGEQVHMSRNNVLYHISKAVEILELPLEEHRIRFGLLIAYNLLGIYF